MAATLTVANSSIVLTVEGIHPHGVPLTGYAADNVFEMPTVENGEFSMGIDGKLSAGWVPNPIPLTLTFQADSPSIRILQEIWQREQSTRDKLRTSLTIALPSANLRYTARDGFMQSFQAPSGQRILHPGVAVFIHGKVEFSQIS
jgi:hypothetical protein